MFTSQVAIAQDFREQAGSDDFSGMHRNDRSPAIRMQKDMRVSLNSSDLESGLRERMDDFFARQPRHAAHDATMIV